MIATVVDQEDLTTYSASLYSYLTSLRWSFFRERLQEDFPSLLYCGLWWSGKHTSQILCTASVVFLVCTLPSLKAIFYTSTASEIIGTHLSCQLWCTCCLLSYFYVPFLKEVFQGHLQIPLPCGPEKTSVEGYVYWCVLVEYAKDGGTTYPNLQSTWFHSFAYRVDT